MSDPHWTQRPEGGGRFAIWLIRGIVLRLGRPLGRLLLYPITAYFLVRRSSERRASLAYLRRALGRKPTLLDGARHVHCFAATILDRPLLLTDRLDRFDIRVHGVETVHECMAMGKGVLLLGAHLGSFEVLRVLSLQRPDARVAVLLERSQNPAMTQLLEELNPRLAASVIDLGMPSTELMLRIKEEAEQGALIGVLGDRRRAGEPGVPVPFLGEQAWFPVAPYLMASVLKLPVCLCFGLYRGGRRYDLHFELFAERIDLPRGDRRAALQDHVQRYASRLQHYVREAPYNWFNFYDFWIDDAPSLSYRRTAVAVDAGASAGRRP
ncbi:acyltransferase [Pseudofulvimonas gallinarii]|jgi:predicted LPLAT superfamily acyltransferase|uniref:Putative LPLAT superfamily acyltransferase n=1 Tax=Pseudofulvimonas gallinarii TaxID=634155 RepID=A0A4R3LJ36_9GAMM|nr:acyltransferase [Pseudofulvimonas gallinarii]TCT00270.1 putative LPLAT superfamily acyltransferase [Pseudofulvimonas gallinarii]THD14113.1 acyltransferase [Pseudofulvimonas gallinarii]